MRRTADVRVRNFGAQGSPTSLPGQVGDRPSSRGENLACEPSAFTATTKTPPSTTSANRSSTGPLDVIVKIGGAGVCRTDLHILEGQWDAIQHPAALRDRPRERRLGARGRRRRHQRGGRRHGDPASAAELRAVPRLPPRRRHALRERLLPRPVEPRRRHGRVPADDGPGLREARPATNPADVAALADAGITAYHAVRKAVPLLHPGTTAVVQGAGGLGHIGIQCLKALTAARVIVVDKNPDALRLAADIGADDTVVADGDHVAAVADLTGGGAHVVLRLRRRAGRGDGRWHMTGAGRLDASSSATAASCASRRWTSSPARRTSSATSSAPTPTWPS